MNYIQEDIIIQFILTMNIGNFLTFETKYLSDSSKPGFYFAVWFNN